MTYSNKEICLNKFKIYFIATKIIVKVTYRNKITIAVTYSNKEICLNKFKIYFIATKIIVKVTYRNKKFVAINYINCGGPRLGLLC